LFQLQEYDISNLYQYRGGVFGMRYLFQQGGKREGAGRKPLGITKKVSITLSQDHWDWLGECIDFGHAKSYSELFRQMVEDNKGE
jgi:hypothetical protein